MGNWCARLDLNQHGLPTAPSTQRVYHFRHERMNFGLEDEAGFEPARGSWARRVKRPMPSTAWLLVHVMEDPGGFEPRAHGLKVRSISSQV